MIPQRRQLTTRNASAFPHFPYFLRDQRVLSPPTPSSWTKIRPNGAARRGPLHCNCEGATPNNPQNQVQQQQNSNAPADEQCAVCMYTGVATCTGLSLYFVKIAMEETTPLRHQRFLYLCSAGWAVAGVYRWYLR